MGKKRKLSAEAPGWQAVTVGDELLVGATEGGFMALEELQLPPGMVLDDAVLGPNLANEPAKAPPALKGKKGKRQRTTEAEVEGGEAALKAELARLRAENKRLRTAADRDRAEKGGVQKKQRKEKLSSVAAAAGVPFQQMISFWRTYA